MKEGGKMTYEEKLAKMTNAQFALEWAKVMKSLNPNRKVDRKKKRRSRFMIGVKKEIKEAMKKMEGVTIDIDGDDILVVKNSETINLKLEYW